MQTCSAIGSLHREKTDPPSENRVWDFFCVTYSCTGAISPQVPELHQETSSCTTVIVSGVVEWLSKDPIGINGGLNQYVAFGNNPVMFIDPLGLCPDDVRNGRNHLQLYQRDLALQMWHLNPWFNPYKFYRWSWDIDSEGNLRDIKVLESVHRRQRVIYRHRGLDYTPSAFGNYVPAYALSQQYGDFTARTGLVFVRFLLVFDSLYTNYSDGLSAGKILQGTMDDHRARKYYHHQGLRHARQDRRRF